MDGAIHLGCRAIVAADEERVVDLLSSGFAARSRAYWQDAFATLRDRCVPDGCPRFGHALVVDGVIVGIILLICVAVPDENGVIRCNLSSWYVEPRFRIYASVLVKAALSHKHLTYTNTSSAAHTRETVLSQGFTCYARGQLLAVPALGGRVPGLEIHRILPGEAASSMEAGDRELKLLTDHARAGCISLRCIVEGEVYPFVFLRRRLPKVSLPCAQLIYCRDLESFWRLRGPVGRYLLAQGLPVTMSEANGPAAGSFSRFFPGRSPAYFFGPHHPRLGDLAYGEAVLFGP